MKRIQVGGADVSRFIETAKSDAQHKTGQGGRKKCVHGAPSGGSQLVLHSSLTQNVQTTQNTSTGLVFIGKLCGHFLRAVVGRVYHSSYLLKKILKVIVT